MNTKLRVKLAEYVCKVSGRTIDNMIQELVNDQEARIKEESKADKDGLKFYKDLLKMLKPEKAPSIPEIDLGEEEGI